MAPGPSGSGSNRVTSARALRSGGSRASPGSARAGGGASLLLLLWAPPPRGARTTRPEDPPPLPLPAQLAASLYPTSGFPRWLVSAAAAPEPFWTRFSSPPPTPPPVHGPSGLGPCARGPGPAPPRHARARRPPARAPPPSPGPRVAPESGPQPVPPAAALSPAPPPGSRSPHAARDEGVGSARGTSPQEGAGRRARPPPGPVRPGSAARPCPWAPGVRGAAPRNMTAPWAALALLWGSLCAGKNGRGVGGAGRARGAGARCLPTKGGPRPPPRHLHQLAPPRAPR